ncbi:MAG TPA: biopolymer transporter ExbD [Thermoanaerobaculia bacterium]|jgi:biopolymer transport protein ExbD
MRFDRRKVSEEIPTSSMADITFLLIIFFMVTSTFAATRGLDFALPKEDRNPPLIEKEDAVLITIRPGGAIEMDNKPTPFEGIHAYLKPRLEKNQTKPVIIRPEPNAAYGDMVRVYDLLRQIKLLEGKLVVREDVEPITDERWNGAKELNISIPTQREIDQFWY